MCKSEIFAEILQFVSQETEISPEQILSNKKDEETVDARYLLVYFLHETGYSTSRIACFLHKDKRTVNIILAQFNERCKKKILGIILEKLRKTFGNK